MNTDKKKKTRFNKLNETAKYRYRQHQRCISWKDEKTLLAELKHLRGFEGFINFEGFEKFNDQLADKYIQDMFAQNLSLSYISDNLRALKEFFKWLELQKCYLSKIDYNPVDYINISRNRRNTSKAREYSKSYTFAEIIQTIQHMPERT